MSLEDVKTGVDAAEDAAPVWSQPDLSILDATSQPPPALPVGEFGPGWARWIGEQAEARSAPPDYVAAALLVTASTLIGNARWVSPWSGWKEPPVMWIAAIGLPSSGKSPGMDAAREHLTPLEDSLAGDFPERQRKHETDKAFAAEVRTFWEIEVKKAAKEGVPPPMMPVGAVEPEPPVRPRLSTSDVTVEKFARLQATQPRGLLLVRDELAGWVGQLDKYGGNGSDRAFWLETFGGRTYTVDRVKDGAEPIVVRHLTGGILGGIQPDRLASQMFAGDDDGLAARFLYVWPDPPPLRRPTVLARQEAARSALGRLLALAMTIDDDGLTCPGELRMSEEAADALHAFRERNRAEEVTAAGRYLSHVGKLPGIAARLALVLEHLWWTEDAPEGVAEPEEVGVGAVRSAVTLVEDYFRPMARRVMADAALPQAERDALTLARWMAARRPLPEAVNARELRRMGDGPGIRDAQRMDAGLAELTEAGWLKPDPGKSDHAGGRRAKTFCVNPKLGPALRARAATR